MQKKYCRSEWVSVWGTCLSKCKSVTTCQLSDNWRKTTVGQVLDYLSYDIETLISDRQTDCDATTFTTRSNDDVTTSATESHAISS